MKLNYKRLIITVVIGLGLIAIGQLISTPASAASMTKVERANRRIEIRNEYLNSIRAANLAYNQAVFIAKQNLQQSIGSSKTGANRLAARSTYTAAIVQARTAMSATKLQARTNYIANLREINWLTSKSSKGSEKGY